MFYSKENKNEGDMNQLKTQFANEVSIKFLETVPLKGKTILDVGCGASASLPTYLHEKGALYHLIDYQKAMVDEMRIQLQENNLPCNLSSGDITNLAFPSDSFDYVHERLVLMHVQNKELAMRECLRVAKKKVFFVGIDWSTFEWRKEDSHIGDFYKIYNEFMQSQGSDLSFGGKIKSLWKEISINQMTDEILYKRDFGNHSYIIISVCNAIIGQMNKMPREVQRLKSICKIVAKKGALITPAVMNVVVATKINHNK